MSCCHCENKTCAQHFCSCSASAVAAVAAFSEWKNGGRPNASPVQSFIGSVRSNCIFKRNWQVYRNKRKGMRFQYDMNFIQDFGTTVKKGYKLSGVNLWLQEEGNSLHGVGDLLPLRRQGNKLADKNSRETNTKCLTFINVVPKSFFQKCGGYIHVRYVALRICADLTVFCSRDKWDPSEISRVYFALCNIFSHCPWLCVAVPEPVPCLIQDVGHFTGPESNMEEAGHRIRSVEAQPRIIQHNFFWLNVLNWRLSHFFPIVDALGLFAQKTGFGCSSQTSGKTIFMLILAPRSQDSELQEKGSLLFRVMPG